MYCLSGRGKENRLKAFQDALENDIWEKRKGWAVKAEMRGSLGATVGDWQKNLISKDFERGWISERRGGWANSEKPETIWGRVQKRVFTTYFSGEWWVLTRVSKNSLGPTWGEKEGRRLNQQENATDPP